MHDRRPLPSDDLAILVAPFDRWVFYPAARLLFRVVNPLPISPNQISVLHLLIGVSTFWWLAKPSGPNVNAAVGLFLLRNVLDCLDGVVARAKNKASSTGRVLDEWSDALSAVALIGGAGAAAWRSTPAAWIPILSVTTIVATAILALQNELCRRRLTRAIETGEDCVWPDYDEARARRFGGVGGWCGHLADKTKIRLSGARLDPVRLQNEARLVQSGTGTPHQRRLLRTLSFAAGDNAILVLIGFVLAGSYTAGMIAATAYSLVFARVTYLAMTRHLAPAAAQP